MDDFTRAAKKKLALSIGANNGSIMKLSVSESSVLKVSACRYTIDVLRVWRHEKKSRLRTLTIRQRSTNENA